MYLGFSKSLGNGFRIGMGTKLGGGSKKSKKPSAKEIKDKEFNVFTLKAQEDFNRAVITFVEANGHDFGKLQQDKSDLNDIFKDNEKYEEFMSIYSEAKEEVDKILYSGDRGVTARREITDNVFKIKNYIEDEYPNFEIKHSPIIRDKQEFSFGTLFFTLFVLFFIVMSCSDKTDTTSKTISTTTQTKTLSQTDIQKEKQEIIKKLKTIPTKNWKENLILYKKLLSYEPTNTKYQNKVNFYKAKGSKNKSILKTLVDQ